MQTQVALMRSGMPSITQWAANLGIDKNKGISHLYVGRRPLPMASPLGRSESQLARRKTSITFELSGHYRQDIFSYRAEVKPVFMVLVNRALLVQVLETQAHA